MTFKDHFSANSAGYAAYRPTYPRSVVDRLADLCPLRDRALDVGCGTGQLSVLLADRFRHVVAVDASAPQIESAEPHARVEYRVAPAHATGLPDRSVNLITAAQAAHWFDLPAFYAEARRVGIPGGVLALITYGILRADPAVDPVIQDFYSRVAGPHWPPERRHVEEGYRGFDFPFDEIAPLPLSIDVRWDLRGLLGYVDTWSAVRQVEKVSGRAPLDAFREALEAAWGDPEESRAISFPLSFRIGRL